MTIGPTQSVLRRRRKGVAEENVAKDVTGGHDDEREDRIIPQWQCVIPP